MPADALRVAQIYVDSWNAGFPVEWRGAVLDENRIARWRAELTGGATSWWVAEQSAGTVVGFVGIGPSRDPVDATLGELDTIGVEPRCWRKGVGTALMQTALEALAKEGFREAILWTVAGYDAAQRFYASAGWTKDGGVRDNGHQVSFRHSLQEFRPVP